MSIREELRHQDRIHEALQGYSKEELIDILAHLVKAYVIDGIAPVKPDVGKIHVPKHLRELSFPVLLETLKFHLDLPELEKLNVVNGQVYVKLGEREFALDGPPPGRSELSAPRQAEPAAPPPPIADGPRATPAAAPPAAEKKPAGPAEVSDRFRMLELD